MSVYVDERPLDDIGFAGDLEWSHRWPGGPWTARWTMAGLSRSDHQVLHRGARVEIRHGPVCLWGPGFLADPDPMTGVFFADGPARVLEKLQAIDGSGEPTNSPQVALTAAVARGALVIDGWDTLPASFPSTSARTIKQLLDDAATAESKRWGVIHNRIVFTTTETTPTPRWAISPDRRRLGLASDDFATSIQLRYVASLGGVPAVPASYATAIAPDPALPNPAADRFGPAEVPVDATSYGLLTATQAGKLAKGIYNAGRARLGFTGSYDLAPVQLTTLGGQPAFLPYVVADGSAARALGVLDDRGNPALGLAQDFVIGETVHSAASRLVRITPAETAARTYGANLEKIGSR